MEVQLLNGGTNSLVPMNGTNASYPMNGTNASVPMQGSNGVIYYVAPISLMDIDQVPTDWIPTGLSDDDILYLKTAYLMGDPEALNGKLGDKLKQIGTAITGTVGKIANTIAPVVSQIPIIGKPVAAATTIGINALNNKIAADQAKKKAKEAGLDNQTANEASYIAEQSMEELTKVGINADPNVVADRAIMAADAGVKSGGGGGLVDRIKNWWAGASTGEKVFAGVATAALVYGGYKGVQYMTSKGKKKKRKS